jgi:hypothetical protein
VNSCKSSVTSGKNAKCRRKTEKEGAVIFTAVRKRRTLPVTLSKEEIKWVQ